MGRIITLAIAALVTPSVIGFSPDVKAQSSILPPGNSLPFSTAQELEWVRAHSTPPQTHNTNDPDQAPYNDPMWVKAQQQIAALQRTSSQRQMAARDKYYDDMGIDPKIIRRANQLFPAASQGYQRTQYIIDEMRATADRQQGNSYSIRVR